jgi:hypothetical protein
VKAFTSVRGCDLSGSNQCIYREVSYLIDNVRSTEVYIKANTEETRRAEFLRMSMIHRCDDLILDQDIRALDYRTSESGQAM